MNNPMQLIHDYPQLAARFGGDWRDEDHELMNRIVGAGQELLELALAQPGDGERIEGDVPRYTSQIALLLDYDWDEMVGNAIEFAHVTDLLWDFRTIVELGNEIISFGKKTHRQATGRGETARTMRSLITGADFNLLYDNLVRAMAVAITIAEEEGTDIAVVFQNNLVKLEALTATDDQEQERADQVYTCEGCGDKVIYTDGKWYDLDQGGYVVYEDEDGEVAREHDCAGILIPPYDEADY